MAKPLRADLKCYKGQTYLQNIYFTCNKQPIDLTGYVAKAEVRPSENSKILTATMSCSVDESAGKVTLYLGESITAELKDGFYNWDLKMKSETDTVGYWLAGQFIVSGRVTE